MPLVSTSNLSRRRHIICFAPLEQSLSMWWFCRPLLLLIVVLDRHTAACGASSTAPAGPWETQPLWRSSDSAALDPRGFLPDSLSYAAETVQSVGHGMRERVQLGLVPLERSVDPASMKIIQKRMGRPGLGFQLLK